MTSQPHTPPIIQVSGLSKHFHGVPALRHVTLQLQPGEMHAIAGENGAGKSTLMKILSGVYPPDTGDIHIDGHKVNLRTPRDAQQHGIITIYQEFNLIPHLSISENIFLGFEPLKRGLLDWKKMHLLARDLMNRVGLHLDPSREVSTLGVGEQQMVEIAKALHHQARVVIMDEPTAALSLTETQELFRVVEQLKLQGITIVFISHHLEEIFEMADRVTVLRDGQSIQTLHVLDTTPQEVIRLMVGRNIDEQYPRTPPQSGPERLRVDNLTRKDRKVRGVSLKVHAGEVLGIGGLMGAGRTELLRAIFGADPSSHQIHIDGTPHSINSTRQAVRLGLGFLTEDRKRQGLLPTQTVRENLTLGVLSELGPGPLIQPREEHRTVKHFIQKLGIKTHGTEQHITSLSGGNQQKVLLSRWLALGPKILLLDEPTRGVDVGAKVEIYRLINHMAQQGMAILMVSSDLPELLGMSDRILVMHEGQVRGELTREQFSQEAVMQLAAGQGASA